MIFLPTFFGMHPSSSIEICAVLGTRKQNSVLGEMPDHILIENSVLSVFLIVFFDIVTQKTYTRRENAQRAAHEIKSKT